MVSYSGCSRHGRVWHRKQSRSWKGFAKEKDCTKLTILRLGISKNYTVGISQVFDIPNFISQLRFGNYCAFGNSAPTMAEYGLYSRRQVRASLSLVEECLTEVSHGNVSNFYS